MRTLRIGFVPLVDAASVIVAARRGHAEAEGLALELSRERSWAGVRDKLTVGYLDAAHVLSPMVVASRLGLGNFRSALMAPTMLSLDGNEVTVGTELAALCAARTGYTPLGPVEWGRALAGVVREGAGRGAPPLTFAAVFPFSSHTYLLRDWLAEAGIDPDRDVNVTVLPPPMLADALAEGTIDGFCAGPPWGRLAEERGAGRIAFRAVRLRSGVPEKALALRESDPMRDPDTVSRLVRAIRAAAAWTADPANADDMFDLLAEPGAVGVPARTIRAAVDRSGMRLAGDDVLRPDPAHGAWIAARMARWGQVRGSESGGESGGMALGETDRAGTAPNAPDGLAGAAFRADLFDAAVDGAVDEAADEAANGGI